MKLFLYKRGNVIDLMTSPLFVTIVALGLVGLSILQAATQIGTDTTFEQKYYSADAALLIDSFYALRKDLNINYNYFLPSNFGMNVEPSVVTVYTEKTPHGNKFYFTQDSRYELTGGNFPPGKKKVIYRNGINIGVAEFAPTNNPLMPCEGELPVIIRQSVDVNNFGENPNTIIGPDPLIIFQLVKGPSKLIIYTNDEGYSDILACRIAHNIKNSGISFEEYAVLPVITNVLSYDDGLTKIKSTRDTAVFVKLQQPEINNQIKTAVKYAVEEVMSDVKS